MHKPAIVPSPLAALCSALPSLPARLRDVGKFVVANDFDATTRSMRELAAIAGADPASFTRLAQALGYAGWDELRNALIEAQRPASSTPFTERLMGGEKARARGPLEVDRLIKAMLDVDASGLQRVDPRPVADAARALHAAPAIWIAGFRSCRSVAALLSYELRLFRPNDVRMVGASGPADLDHGAFHKGEAVVICGFAPYSRASVETARAAAKSEAMLVALTDSPVAPMAEGADHLLLFEAASTPGFFPSLTGALAIAQALAAATFMLGGAKAKKALLDTEARLAATAQYVAEKGKRR